MPEVDPKTYRLEVNLGNGKKPLSLSLDELKSKFKQHTLTVAIQCAGNRRDEMNGIKKVKGLTWAEGAIGNAKWTGVKLRDVLLEAGFKDSEINGSKQVQFEGLDVDVAKAPYGASVPLEKAMDPNRDVLIAFAMNGEDIPKDHGYPVRIIIPGVVGARQVKWLSKIIIADEESRCHWQRNDYKGFSPSTDWDTVDFTTMPAIQDLPVQSAICEPANGTVLEAGTEEFTVKGYAWSGGGRGIVRVDVSPDGGWYQSNLIFLLPENGGGGGMTVTQWVEYKNISPRRLLARKGAVSIHAQKFDIVLPKVMEPKMRKN